MIQVMSVHSVMFPTCVSSVTSDTFAGEKIPTLEEAVEECIKLQLTIYFDVKGHPDEVLLTKLTLECAIHIYVIFVDLIDVYIVSIA